MRRSTLLSRILHVVFFTGLNPALTPLGAVAITDATYEARLHFKIVTSTATYFFDRGGGGLSRMIDRDGHDWIAFHKDPPITAPSPAFTASAARGIPNSVFKLDDGGASHPGFDQCESTMLDERTIRVVSKSGKWQWTWVFAEDHAVMTVDRADPSRTYWFLYEGPIAGSFAPARKFWGTNLGGPRFETPDLLKGKAIHETWRWAYFGDRDVPRVLFVVQTPADDLIDGFSYMGNNRAAGVESPDGMVVFGFGRAPAAKPLLNKSGLRFFLGFLEGPIAGENDHRRTAARIERLTGGPP